MSFERTIAIQNVADLKPPALGLEVMLAPTRRPTSGSARRWRSNRAAASRLTVPAQLLGRAHHHDAVLTAEAERVRRGGPDRRRPGLERDVVEVAFGVGRCRLVVGGSTPSRIASTHTITDSAPAAPIR